MPSAKEVYDTLVAARATIAEPAAWTKDNYATDAAGEPCGEQEVEAVCFCTLGAIQKHVDFAGAAYLRPLRKAVEEKTGRKCPNIPYYNDHPDTTHADILTMFDRGIEIAKADVEAAA